MALVPLYGVVGGPEPLTVLAVAVGTWFAWLVLRWFSSRLSARADDSENGSE